MTIHSGVRFFSTLFLMMGQVARPLLHSSAVNQTKEDCLSSVAI
jgi:hypothetical protein